MILEVCWDDGLWTLIPHPHILVCGHQRTVSTSKGCNQWFSLAKTLLKVALAGGNRSLVAHTSKHGWAITIFWASPNSMVTAFGSCVEVALNNRAAGASQ